MGLAGLKVMENVCSDHVSCNKHVIFCFPAVLGKTKATNNLVLLVQTLWILMTGNNTKYYQSYHLSVCQCRLC